MDTSNLPHHDKEAAEAVGNIAMSTGSQLPTPVSEGNVLPHWKEAFSDARTNVAFATPLLAYMMFQCEYVWTYDVPTAGALPYNGKNYIYINPDFWMSRLANKEERAFVLLHEISHIFLEHCGRQVDNGYNAQLWNIAADYCINLSCNGAYKDENGSLSRAWRYERYVSCPKFCLYDERFMDMSSDEIYHQLLDEADGDMNKAIRDHGGQPESDGEDDGEGSEGSGQGGQPGQGNAKGQMPLDHIPEHKPEEGQVGKNRQCSSAAVASADAAKAIGDSEANLVKTIRDLSAPRVDWREELASAVMSSTKERPTYTRLSRRTSGDVKFPSLTGFKVKGVYGADSSGSMSQKDYADCAGELKGILEQFESWELDLLTCDTKAHFIGRYSSEDGDDFTDVDLEFKGGGGTFMNHMVEYANGIQDEEGDIAFNIIVTDGYLCDDDLQSFRDEMVNIVLITSEGNPNYTHPDCRVIHMKDIG